VKKLYKEHEYYVKFGWTSNPFTLTISPDLMVGYPEQTKALLSHIYNFHKFALITGHTGSGKTTVLLWLKTQTQAYKKFIPYYIPKSPKSKEEFLTLMKSLLKLNIFDKILYRNLTLFNLPRFIRKKTKKKHLVLLIDEAHESSLDVLEWIRTITDSVPNMSVVFAGLPTFENFIETKLPTLAMRITTKVYLNSLTRTETEDLIRKRIDKVGGDGLKPFSIEAVDEIFKITGGFPREIIKLCDKLVHEASISNISTITPDFIYKVHKLPEAKPSEIKLSLSVKQRRILEILNTNPKITPAEIVEKIGKEEYKNRSNAVRSINNILKRLMQDGLVERQKIGNSYLYYLSGKAKTIFAEA
jgi:type II secretory pathway predicted ATPase ExeA